jgi:hypothetical protein
MSNHSPPWLVSVVIRSVRWRDFLGGVGRAPPLALWVDPRGHAAEAARFHSKVVAGPDDADCIWIGSIRADGYGSHYPCGHGILRAAQPRYALALATGSVLGADVFALHGRQPGVRQSDWGWGAACARGGRYTVRQHAAHGAGPARRQSTYDSWIGARGAAGAFGGAARGRPGRSVGCRCGRQCVARCRTAFVLKRTRGAPLPGDEIRFRCRSWRIRRLGSCGPCRARRDGG